MKILIEKEISAAPDIVWQIIGQRFTAIDQWFSTVKSSRTATKSEVPVGFPLAKDAPFYGRVTKTFFTATEILSEYSDQERRFTFIAVDVPKFLMAESKNQTKVIEISENQCKVQIQINIDFKWPFLFMDPIMERRMTNLMNNQLEALEQVAKAEAKHLIY